MFTKYYVFIGKLLFFRSSCFKIHRRLFYAVPWNYKDNRRIPQLDWSTRKWKVCLHNCYTDNSFTMDKFNNNSRKQSYVNLLNEDLIVLGFMDDVSISENNLSYFIRKRWFQCSSRSYEIWSGTTACRKKKKMEWSCPASYQSIHAMGNSSASIRTHYCKFWLEPVYHH